MVLSTRQNIFPELQKEITTAHVFTTKEQREYPQTRKVVYRPQRAKGRQSKMTTSPKYIDESDTDFEYERRRLGSMGETLSGLTSNRSTPTPLYSNPIVQEVALSYSAPLSSHEAPAPLSVKIHSGNTVDDYGTIRSNAGSLQDYLSDYDVRVASQATTFDSVGRSFRSGRQETEFPVRSNISGESVSSTVYSVPIVPVPYASTIRNYPLVDSRASTQRVASSLADTIVSESTTIEELTTITTTNMMTRRENETPSPRSVNLLTKQFEQTTKPKEETKPIKTVRSPVVIAAKKPESEYLFTSEGSRVHRVQRPAESSSDKRGPVLSTTIVDIEPAGYRTKKPRYVEESYQVQEEFVSIKTYGGQSPKKSHEREIEIERIIPVERPVRNTREQVSEKISVNKWEAPSAEREEESRSSTPVKSVVQQYETKIGSEGRRSPDKKPASAKSDFSSRHRAFESDRSREVFIPRGDLYPNIRPREEYSTTTETVEEKIDVSEIITTRSIVREEKENMEHIRKEIRDREEQEERDRRARAVLKEERERQERRERERREREEREEREEQERRALIVLREERERKERKEREERERREAIAKREREEREEYERLEIIARLEREAEERRFEDERRARLDRERREALEKREKEERERREALEKRDKEAKERREAQEKERQERLQKARLEREKEERERLELIEQLAREERLKKIEQEERERRVREAAEMIPPAPRSPPPADEDLDRYWNSTNMSWESYRRETWESVSRQAKKEEEEKLKATAESQTETSKPDLVEKETETDNEQQISVEKVEKETETDVPADKEVEELLKKEREIDEPVKTLEESEEEARRRRTEENTNLRARTYEEISSTWHKHPRGRDLLSPYRERKPSDMSTYSSHTHRSASTTRIGGGHSSGSYGARAISLERSTNGYEIGGLTRIGSGSHIHSGHRSASYGVLSGGSHAALNIRDAREREKKEIMGLNDRLANYIEKVRFLEAQNRKLSNDLEVFSSRWQRGAAALREMYEAEIKAANLYSHGAVENIESSLTTIRTDITTQRSKYEEAYAHRESLRLEGDDTLQKLAVVEAEIFQVRRRIQMEEEEIMRLKVENQRVMAEIARFRSLATQESMARADYQAQIDQLVAEVSYQSRAQSSQLNDLFISVGYDSTPDNRAYFKAELAAAIRDIRAEYETIQNASRHDLDIWYQMQVKDIHSYSSKSSQEHFHAKEEVKRVRTTVAEVRSMVADLETRNMLMTKQIEELNYQIKEEHASYEISLGEKDSAIRKMREECEGLIIQLQVLLDTKKTLDAEISSYRAMLDTVETRGGYRYEAIHSSHGAHSGFDRFRAESAARTSFQRSAKGIVAIHETSADGRYVVLENTHHSKEESLGGWRLVRELDHGRKVEVVFPFSFVLGPQKFVKLYARGQGHNSADSLVFNDVESFGTGINVRTTLYNDAGEERAALIQRGI